MTSILTTTAPRVLADMIGIPQGKYHLLKYCKETYEIRNIENFSARSQPWWRLLALDVVPGISGN